MNLKPGQNPYNNFKDDHERQKALFWRDVRLVVIAGIGAMASGTAPWKEFLVWLISLVRAIVGF
jgi:fatty acid desaturase